MPAYRAYFIDKDDQIIGTETVHAVGLGDAIDRALLMLRDVPDLRSVELWQEDRRLCSVVPAPHLRAQILAPHDDLDGFATPAQGRLEFLVDDVGFAFQQFRPGVLR